MDGTTDLITVNCDYHHQILKSTLWNFVQAKHGVDIGAECGGQSFQAHRLILEVFLSPDKLMQVAAEKQKDDCRDLDSLLEFLYRGTVTVRKERLANLLTVAKESGFQMLVNAVGTAVISNAKASSSNQRRSGRQTTKQTLQSITTDDLLGHRLVESEINNVAGQSGADLRKQHVESEFDNLNVTEIITKIKSEPIDELECENVGEITSTENELTDVASCLQVQLQEDELMGGKKKIKDEYNYDRPDSKFIKLEPQSPRDSGSPDQSSDDSDYQPDKSSVPATDTKIIKQEMTNYAKLLTCNLCSETFANRRDLMRHTPTHVPREPYKCNVCGENYTALRNSVVHAKLHAEKCGENYTALQNLVAHAKLHAGDDARDSPQLECQFCGRIFKDRKTLIIHSWVHSQKTYLCDECFLTFTSRQVLIAHAKTHRGARPFKCTLCNKSFATNKSMAQHLPFCTGKLS